MKQIDEAAEGVFKYLSKDEVTNRMKAAILNTNDKGSKNTRGWKAEDVLIRRQTIWDWIAQGWSNRMIHQEISDKWNVSVRTAHTYLTDALKALCLEQDEVCEHTRNKQIERMEKMLSDCLERNDYSNAAKAMDMLNKMNGLYSEKKDINIESDIPIKFKFGE